MFPKVSFRGSPAHRVRAVATISQAIARATARRSSHGPRLPHWNWTFEIGTEILRDHVRNAFLMKDVAIARRYLETVLMDSALVSKVKCQDVTAGAICGTWFYPENAVAGRTLLYLHGGGYSFYPKLAYRGFLSVIAHATRCAMFVPEYRLAPEYPFPAQLEDALHAYRFICGSGISPEQLSIGGDSAGGHLTISLLLALRDASLPMPAFAFALSPATEFDAARASMVENEAFDWIDIRMLIRWANWFCQSHARTNPNVSLLRADLRGLPPLYVQAGGSEILIDSILAFVDVAREQGAKLEFDSYPEMNHVFQAFGYDVPQSAEALRKLGYMLHTYTNSAEAENPTDDAVMNPR